MIISPKVNLDTESKGAKMGEFDHSKGRGLAERILSKLKRTNPNGVSRSEFSSFGSSKEVGEALTKLLDAGMATYEITQQPRGRPLEIGWVKEDEE